MPKNLIFDIAKQFTTDATDIFAAHQKALISHNVGNIPSAGNEVEEAVRSFVRGKIPAKYYTTKGHIVDSKLSASSHFDILIADDKGSPILFSNAHSDDFLTYESIYAIGEVKSTYYKHSNPITEFIDKVKKVNKMTREESDMHQQSQEFKTYSNTFPGDRTSEGWYYKSPLFKFMLFVNSEGAKLDDVLSILRLANTKHVPNIICFLDRGIILNARQISNSDNGIPINGNPQLYPEFQDKREAPFNWFLYEFTQGRAANLSYLIYALNFHLQHCVLQRADLVKYHEQMFALKQVYTA